jgi:hypothetical protein
LQEQAGGKNSLPRQFQITSYHTCCKKFKEFKGEINSWGKEQKVIETRS